MGPMPHLPLAALALSASASIALAQVAPGHRMIAPHGTTETYLIDTEGVIVHTWPGGYPPGNGAYLDADGTLLRCGQVAGHPGPGGAGGAVERIAFDGTVLWEFAYASADHWHHHDAIPMPNGNVLMIAWDILDAADAVAAGRDPALLGGSRWMPDTIVEVEPAGPTTGVVVWKWSVMDHLVQDFDATKANFGVVADHPELLDVNFPPTPVPDGDWNHANAISYDPVRDLILINFPFQDELYLIDHSTTTAEAAGHTGGDFGRGGDFLYRWGNPASYDAGTAADQALFNQHGVKFIPEGLPGAGHVLGFNNQAGTPLGQNFSAVFELELPADFSIAPGQPFGPSGYVWEYTAPNPTDFFSGFVSSAERLPNGHTLVDSGRQNGWLFELDTSDQIVWEYFNQLPSPTALVFQVSYVERTLWSDASSVSVSGGGAIDFDLVAGSANAGDFYVLLGSFSGTAPGLILDGNVLPLAVDAYFAYTLANPNAPPFAGSLGVLDGSGNASASFTLPAGSNGALVGIEAHHACVVLDPALPIVTRTTNAVPLTFAP